MIVKGCVMCKFVKMSFFFFFLAEGFGVCLLEILPLMLALLLKDSKNAGHIFYTANG